VQRFATDSGWRVEGDPTEGAFLVLGHKAGFTQHLGRSRHAWASVARPGL
jgi:magnesium-transporting ATPase (P-type)